MTTARDAISSTVHISPKDDYDYGDDDHDGVAVSSSSGSGAADTIKVLCTNPSSLLDQHVLLYYSSSVLGPLA